MLDAGLELQEVVSTVQEHAVGCATGIGELTNEFYKQIWKLLGVDLSRLLSVHLIVEVYQLAAQEEYCHCSKKKKIDLGFLKNWRPGALLCSDFKILSHRLKLCMHTIMH